MCSRRFRQISIQHLTHFSEQRFVKQGKINLHTLWIANDNDFLTTVADANNNQIPNPNQFFVVGFTEADLGGSTYAPQQVTPLF